MHPNIIPVLLTALLLLLQSCSMLDNPEPRERKIEETYAKYSYIPAAKKEVLLKEEFTSNSRNWRVIHSFQYRIAIESGLLTMYSDYTGAERSAITVSALTGNENFEIEALIREDRTSNMGIRNRFVWGLHTTTNQYRFMEIDDNYQQFYIGTNYGSTSRIDYYSASQWRGAYIGRGFNKYTIRKIENMYYYFVNETLLFSEPFTSFNGSGIGFQVGNYNALSVESLTIHRINR